MSARSACSDLERQPLDHAEREGHAGEGLQQGVLGKTGELCRAVGLRPIR